jgi:hypothetical protein
VTSAFREAITRVADALDACGLTWAVTGSFALAYHGIVRATQDVDVKVMAAPGGDEWTCVRDRLGAGFRALDDTTFRFRDVVDVELYPLDGASDREALERRVHAHLFQGDARRYWVVTAEDLVLSKVRELVRWRDLKQVDDVRKLVVAHRKDLDWDYMERRLHREEGFAAAWEKWIEPREGS